MLLVFSAAAADLDLSKLPERVAGAFIGYELCVSGAADKLAKAEADPAKLFETAKLACAKESAHFETVFDDEFIERHPESAGPEYERAFEEHQKQLEAMKSHAERLFTALVRNSRSK